VTRWAPPSLGAVRPSATSFTEFGLTALPLIGLPSWWRPRLSGRPRPSALPLGGGQGPGGGRVKSGLCPARSPVDGAQPAW